MEKKKKKKGTSETLHTHTPAMLLNLYQQRLTGLAYLGEIKKQTMVT